MSGWLSVIRAFSWRYWRRHSVRAMLLLACLALGVATWTATRALERGVQQSGRNSIAPLVGAADFSISNDDAGVLRQWTEPLSRAAGVRAVQPILIRRGRLPGAQPINVLVLGIDLVQANALFADQIRLSPNAIPNLLGAALRGESSVLVGGQLATEFAQAGSTFTVTLDGKSHRMVTAGRIESATQSDPLFAGNILIMNLTEMGRMIGDRERVSRLDILLEPGADAGAVRQRLEAIIAGKARIRTAKSMDERAGDMLAALTTAFSLCGVGAIVAGLLLIHNVFSVSVAERRPESGILRSLGATRGQLLAGVGVEALIFGATGGFLGLPLGYGLARIAIGPIQQILSEVFLPLSGGDVRFTVDAWLGGVLIGIIASLVAATWPAMQMAGVDPREAMRRLAETPGRVKRWRSLLLIMTLAAVGIFLQFARVPIKLGPWPSLICFVLAGLAASPPLTRLLTWFVRLLVRRWAGTGGMLALDNLLRWPRRYGLATATLAAGAALLMQTGGIIHGNEEALRDWLDRSVIGDLFVTSGGPLSASGQNLPMSDELGIQWRQHIAGLHVVPMRFRYVDWQQNGHSARLLLVLLDASAYRSMIDERFANLPDRALYQQLSEEPETAVVSRNFASLYGLKSGDHLVLPSATGPQTLRILGTVADYSCTQGTVLLDRRRYAALFDAGLVDVYSVGVPPGVSIETVRRECLRSSSTGVDSLYVVTHDEMRGHTLGMIQRLYGVAVAQLAVISLVSILGVAATMFISVLQRSGELGLLRALGATRFQIIRVVLAEALLIGVLGTATGLLLGIPLQWFTVKIVLFTETGFDFPMQFPWREAVIVACAAPIGAALAGLLPALRAARLNPVGACAGE